MVVRRRSLILGVYKQLREAFGPQDWWPAETPFEVIVGAILTQNTAWKNVEKAIGALRDRGILNFAGILRADGEVLAELIRPSGYYNQKARKLKDFCNHIQKGWEGDLGLFFEQPLESMREELLGIRGIGPETADCIVLYAAQKPSFVIDTYTHRIFSRHDWIDEGLQYEELRSFFMDVLDPEVSLFQDYHALLVKTGHIYCRRKPDCDHCPLRGWNKDE